MNRRSVLKLGASLGALGAVGTWGARRLLPPGPSRDLLPVDELARRFVASLDPELRERVVLDYDHPLRQYHNRGVWGGGVRVFDAGFSRHQRALVTDLLHAGLSAQGRTRIPRQFFLRFPGVHLLNVLLCGDPAQPPWQMILSGPHLNLRLGGASREGVAFGGPQVYGDQRGSGRPGLPDNVWRGQLLLGQRVFQALSPALQREALLAAAPVQTRIEVQGRSGVFPGVPLSEAAPPVRVLARELVEGILATWAPADVDHARACLEANGGIEALSFSVYADGVVGGSGESQIFRLEGPAAVFHFRGAPHVHAFVNVAMDGDAPLSVGELLGENPRVLESDGVKRLFERAMRAELGTDLAHYELEAAVGRLRAGPVRSGDIYVLESWQDRVAVVEVRGARLGAALVEALRERGEVPDPGRLYSVATTAEVADDARARIGPAESRRDGVLVREVAVDHLRTHGFDAPEPAVGTPRGG